jgi:hypothetical protein
VTDVVVDISEVTVLAGPSVIDVDVDFGPAGTRGSYTYAVNGNPNNPSTVLPADIKVYDIAINLLTSDDEYLYMYQYISADGSYTWQKLLKLITNTYSTNQNVTFIDGVKSFSIPLVNIVPLANIANLTAENFNIQCSIVNTEYPVVSKVSISEITSNSLPITITAKEFDGSTWSDLTGPHSVHFLITVV